MNQRQKRRAAQKYLERIRKLDTKIRIKKENLAEIKSTLGYRAQSYLERVQTTVSMDGICDAVIELLELEREIGECITEYYRLKEKIVMELFSLSNPVYIDVLSYRHLKYMDFEYISENMKYCDRHIYRVYAQALEAFYEEVLAGKEKEDG